MTTLIEKVNESEEIARLPLRARNAEEIAQKTPVLATPAAFAAGLAAAAAVAGSAAAGAAIGNAVD